MSQSLQIRVRIQVMSKGSLGPGCRHLEEESPVSEVGLQIRVRNWGKIYPFSTKTYVVRTQTNRLNEAVILITQNRCLSLWVRK